MVVSKGLIILGVLVSLFLVSMLFKNFRNFNTEQRSQEIKPLLNNGCKHSDFVSETSREKKNDFLSVLVAKALDIFLAIFKKRTSSNTNEPSPCVWAILTCCNPGSAKYSLECFQAMECSGPFWDKNPCTENMGLAAVECARNYYGASNLNENEFDESGFLWDFIIR